MSKSVFKILSYLRKNHVNKDGKVRSMSSLSVNGDVSQFSSKLDIELELWDVKSEKLSRIVKISPDKRFVERYLHVFKKSLS